MVDQNFRVEKTILDDGTEVATVIMEGKKPKKEAEKPTKSDSI
jgi:hypothetical protein